LSVAASFIPAPFLSNIVLEADSKKPANLVPTLLLAAKRFDEEHQSDPLFKKEAAVHAEDFTLWAWGVQSNKIPET